MTRWVAVALAAVTGLLCGALVALSLQSPALERRASVDDGRPDVAAPAAEPSASPTDLVLPPPVVGVPDAGAEVLLVWTAGGLPAGFADGLAGLVGVETVTVVAAGTLDLVRSSTADGRVVDELTGGWVIPLDAFAIDPDGYATFVSGADRELVAGLRAGQALLGRTSAALRRLGAGDRITTTQGALEVVGVVDDELVGAAEVVVSRATGRGLGLTTERFALVSHDSDRAALEDAIRELAGTAVRVRGPGETPYLRHGDAVLPQAIVKREFGEFAYRPPAGGRRVVEQDPAWQAREIVTADVPILGRVRCHRNVVKQLAGALAELEARGLASLVDPEGYEGCHHPRLVEPGGSLSRHAWGIAVDLNADANPTGAGSRQDPRLVDTFGRWGFTWGGFWLVPDAMHLEWIGPPDPAPAKVVD